MEADPTIRAKLESEKQVLWALRREISELEAQARDVEARFGETEVLRPEGWGGYRVVPDGIEVWQHRDDRLHDRFEYRRSGDEWQVVRLQP
jgi:pyridoxamine 5'-phosphate oxidase